MSKTNSSLKNREAKLMQNKLKNTYVLYERERSTIQGLFWSVKNPKLMEFLPAQKRRKQWSCQQQSEWIESLLLNIPSPPLYFYEINYNHHELIDGHQRLFAIRDFYENNLTLTGITFNPELNGLTYSKLPISIARKLDEYRLATIFVTINDKLPEEMFLQIKQQVFERLQLAWTE